MSNPRRRDDLLCRAVGDELMLYDTAGRAVHVLSTTAQFILERCDGTRSVEDIVREATEVFVAEAAEVRSDVEECLTTFRELELLQH